MKKLAKFFTLICLLGFTLASWALEKVMTEERQLAKTPEQVLMRLKEGNQRFVENKSINRDLLAQAQATSSAQHPVAVVLSCMDSRTPPEMVFDQGIGDVFALRVGGNISNEDILGSMEFGTQLMGAKLIAVIGHTSCGAMRGACQEAQLGHLTQLLHKINPAVVQAKKQSKIKECTSPELIDQIAKDNVALVVKEIQEKSPVLKKLILEGKVGVVGGLQDLTTGKVTFFDASSS